MFSLISGRSMRLIKVTAIVSSLFKIRDYLDCVKLRLFALFYSTQEFPKFLCIKPALWIFNKSLVMMFFSGLAKTDVSFDDIRF